MRLKDIEKQLEGRWWKVPDEEILGHMEKLAKAPTVIKGQYDNGLKTLEWVNIKNPADQKLYDELEKVLINRGYYSDLPF
jgi:hypothetical protein